MTPILQQKAPKITRTPVVHQTAQVRDCVVGDYVEIHEFVRARDTTIGDYTYLLEHVSLLNADIGRFCAIAAMTRLGAPNHPYRRASQHRFTYTPEYYWPEQKRDQTFFMHRSADRVRVGHDVWFGHATTVLPGVTIGTGAVIAAGAVVTRDVEPYTIVAGVPARVIKPRFEPRIAEQLLTIAWWDWSADVLTAALPEFQAMPIEAFVEKYGARR